MHRSERPPGLRLDGEQILVDLHALAAQRGFPDALAYVRQLRVTTDAGSWWWSSRRETRIHTEKRS